MTPAGFARRTPVRRSSRAAACSIGYLDNHGTRSERIVDPRAASRAASSRAYDHRSEDDKTFAVHRITTVRAVPVLPRARKRRVAAWTSSGTPSRRHSCSTLTCRGVDGLVRHLGGREWLHDQCTETDCVALRGFSRRPATRSSRRPGAGNTQAVVDGLNELMAHHPIRR